MKEAKNTARSVVRIGYDGRVVKRFLGPQAKDRFENEVRVLQFLEKKNCSFVPKIVAFDPDQLELVTTNCGQIVESMSDEKKQRIYDELTSFGVRHEDAELRNITYNAQQGRFCVIDFEFATILEPGYPPSPKIESGANRSLWK